MFNHGDSVIPNFCPIRSHDKDRKFLFVMLLKNCHKIWKNLWSMANISKILYFILSYGIVTFCNAYSSIIVLCNFAAQ